LAAGCMAGFDIGNLPVEGGVVGAIAAGTPDPGGSEALLQREKT